MSGSRPGRTVGVIFSRIDLRRALRMRNPPDLFELRLDALVHCLDTVKTAIRDLPAPLIVTARHPREGGVNALSAAERRALLLEFLPYAAYVDVELRSLRYSGVVLQRARTNHIPTIVSHHDLKDTPTLSRLNALVCVARSAGANIIKIATRTDTASQLERLLEFLDANRAGANMALMGIGKLGRVSRVELARRGSSLNYAHLGRPQTAGQLSLRDLQRLSND